MVDENETNENINQEPTVSQKINSNGKDLTLLKTIRLELFSNPFKDCWNYFKRLFSFFKLTLLQYRNPLFRLDLAEDYTTIRTGGFFRILYSFLNPLGKTKIKKVDKLSIGCIEYTKEAISMLVFTVLLQLAFLELADKKTTGNLEVAFLNGLFLSVFFISTILIVKLGGLVSRKINDQNIKKIVEEIFVYESTMVFGFVVLILTLNAFGVISIEDEGLIFLSLFLFVGAHPFYFLLGLNKRLKFTNIFVILFWGFIMSVIVSMTFLIAITIGGFAGGVLG